MRHFFLLLPALFAFSTLFAQTQSTFYLFYNTACMDQLEYRYAYSGASVMAFSAKPNAAEQYIFTAGSGGIMANTLPKGTVDCRDLKLTEDFVESVNRLNRQVYIVQQTQTGYLLTPVVSATRILRSGSYYYLRSLNYYFALDTQNLQIDKNLSVAGSTSYVYYNGFQVHGCRSQYAFRREPMKAGMERASFEFMPGIGVIGERSGKTSAEAQANEVRLWAVNGMNVEDYLTRLCGNMPLPSGGLSGTGGQGVSDNRENALITGPPYPPDLTGSGPCAEPSAPGYYHVVQPKETLNAISRAYNIPVKSLIAWNGLKNPDKISMCQRIFLVSPAKRTSARQGTVAQQGAWQQPQAAAWQPAPSSGDPSALLPQLYDNQQQYQQYYQQYQAPYQASPGGGRIIHVVKQGETLSGLARYYGYTEERFRRMNNLPPTGNFILPVGHQLYASDECASQLPKAPGATTSGLNQGGLQDAVRPLELSATTQTRPQQQLAVKDDPFFETPIYGVQAQTTAGGDQRRTTTVIPQTNFLEHYVQQGETINSIAIKYKVNAQELALSNGKDVNETLIAGQRLLVPRMLGQ